MHLNKLFLTFFAIIMTKRGYFMAGSGNTKVKNASEIGALAGRLNVHNQFYVLNTINFFLSGQNMQKTHRSEAAEEICLKEKR